MQPALAEYRITRLLVESGNSRVYEAVALRDGRACIAKVFDISDETLTARVEHEFELIRALDIEGVVRAVSLQRVGDQLALMLERAPGVDLRTLADGKALPLELFLDIAVQITEILAKTHARRVVHRDIKPANLLYDTASARAHIADFGISVLLEAERRHIYDARVLVGTLPYISPEQTGRTNRSVDFRSDLYSLGVTFYELLTGRRPFESMAPLELIHAHLARMPPPPIELRPELPEPLSRLVMKLLAKAPEHRYQTATGLVADLRALGRLLAHAGIEAPFEAPFELGLGDRSMSLRLPQQLYGRAREQAEIAQRLTDVIAHSDRRTLLLLGPPGVGKSALLGVLDVATVGHGGYVLRGRFDASRELPYSAFVEALTGLLEQFLTESDARLGRWRRTLLAGLGGLVNVACELVPTLSLIVGSTPPAPELGPIEARNRLQLALDSLLTTLAAEAPLVLILDDLQLADHASLALLDSLARGTAGPLLITASVRDAPLDHEHPLALLLRAVADASLPHVELLQIEPLHADVLTLLLRDTLGDLPELDAFAAIVGRKSGGVPLFIHSFLTELVARGQLWPEAGGWRWNPTEVDAATIPDDAVAFMGSKLARQTDEARELLGCAACLGTRFNLAELALVSGRAPAELITTLLALRDDGLLVEVGTDYRFAHDSIQTAAKQLLDAQSWQRVHRAIAGRLIDTHLVAGTLDDRVLGVVEHLIAAGPDGELEIGRALELTGLFLRAGQRALDSAAYDLALRYYEHGLERLGALDQSRGVGDDSNEVGPDELAFGLAFGRAQALSLTGSREQANAAFEQLLARPLADAQFGLVVARRLRLLQFENRQPEAVDLGRRALAKLGAALPGKVSFTRAALCLTRAWLLLRKLDLDAAMAVPACTDPRGAAIVEIVAQLKYPAFVVDNDLFVYLCGVHVLLLRVHGFHETSPVAFADLSLGVSGGLDKAADAARMLDLALHSCARVRRPEAARVNILAIAGTMGWHRTRACAELLHEFEPQRLIALALGEIDHAAFMATLSMEMSLDIGPHLLTIERRVHEQEIDHARRGAQQMQQAAWVIGCVCGSLLGARSSSEPNQHSRALLNPESVRDHGGIATTQSTALAGAALVELVLGDREAAAQTCRDVQPVIGAVLFNSWIVARLYCIACVTHYARITFDGVAADGQPGWLRKCLKLLRGWAIDCPANYRHQLELVLGMQAAARGRIDDAIALLDRAWTNARARGCRWVEGLAAEYIAELLERRGGGMLVEGAWRRAWDAYSAWGAQAKLDKLREAKPELFVEIERRRGSTSGGPISTRTTGAGSHHSSSLDLEAVLHSVGFITEDLQFEQVMLRLLEAVLTNVGADHALLLLERDGELALVAEARTDDGHREVLRRPVRLRELGARVPSTVINLVVRTGKPLVLDDAGCDPRFAGDPYFAHHELRSLLATPILREALLGVLVVENRQGTHGFSPTSVETVRLITGQVASTLDNARLLSALRRSEGRWRSLVDGAPDLIALLDEHGHVVFINRGRIGEHGGADFITAMTERARASWTAAVEQVLTDGLPAELELELDGDLGHGDVDGMRWFAVRLAPIELGSQDLGEVTDLEPRRNAVVVATDISDHKRAEVERAELETQLRQQQRLESLGTLASGIAHEINNPVQGIMNYAELIIASIDDRNTAIEFAGEITHEAERVATIVRNLLAFSRQDRDQGLEATDLQTLVNGTLSLLQAVLRKDHIRIDLDIPPLAVRCRVQQIQQIILNLVTNARDALNQHCPGIDPRRKIEIRGEPGPGGRVRLIVEDHGPGIPDHVVAHIFDPFFTTKGRDKGTGLGLSVSHGIAKEHGGDILVETRLGEGTRFIVELPA